jgi:4-hydroxybenzoate polyprenyltransferase
MAQSHHRQKHKEHLQQFKQRQERPKEEQRSKGATAFGITGAVIGFVAAWFISGEMTWMIVAMIVFGIGGYLWGRSIDKRG